MYACMQIEFKRVSQCVAKSNKCAEMHFKYLCTNVYIHGNTHLNCLLTYVHTCIPHMCVPRQYNCVKFRNSGSFLTLRPEILKFFRYSAKFPPLNIFHILIVLVTLLHDIFIFFQRKLVLHLASR